MIKYYEHFLEKKKSFTYKGIPLLYVDMPFNMTGTDGPFTNACSIRGTENFIMDMLEDPGYAHQLLAFITTASIERIKETRKYLGIESKDIGFGCADDSIVLLSNVIAIYEAAEEFGYYNG